MQYLTCRACGKELTDTRPRQVKRPRKCETCMGKSAHERRKADPVRFLQNKLYKAVNRTKRAWPHELCTANAVRAVLDRCGWRSVLSGETRYELLCIASAKTAPTDLTDVVVLTSREALILARRKTEREREQMLEAAMAKLAPVIGPM